MANFYTGVGLDLIGTYGDVFVITPSAAVLGVDLGGGNFAYHNVDQYGSKGAADCAPGTTFYSAVGHTFYCYPTYFTEDDPVGAHQVYGVGLQGGYPGAVVLDFTTPVAGTVSVASQWGGKGGFGYESCATTGWNVQASVTVNFTQNLTITAGGGTTLDFNNLPITLATSGSCSASGSTTWHISAGALPTGLSLDTATGVISGTPTSSGPYSVTIYAEKKDASAYCWGSITFTGYTWYGAGTMTMSGSSFGPITVNAIPRWSIQRFSMKTRNEERS